ncbi:MAG TPA: SDR family NAD(P)-dependent oxidoreductase [Thermoanaerobaculia bacterium]
MRNTAHKAIAIVGVGAVMPDAPDVPTFWSNIKEGRYSISETPRERWDVDRYFDPDPKTPDKSYSKIGGWVRDWQWDPIAWKLPIPPKVGEAMDRTQKWAISATRQALADYGWPARALDPERTAVILGNAMAGDRHYITALRLFFPEYAKELEAAPSFAALPAEVREAIENEFHDGIARDLPEITEDTMPGELANIIAGRVANLFNFHGPNFVVDAACASAMAAINAAIEGLEEEDYDAVITGGIDANMSASTFIKFCKIGALSATGTRPYADSADGFVMGEGAAVFLLKRLVDAERDGDRVYAVIRGVGGASDGRGKGITAPNPAGQRLAVERAWANAGISPATVGLIEGHGTSTRVGDVAELESLQSVFGCYGRPAGSIPIGSVKSNIGHLKGAAGAAGILKTALALHEKVLPPSLNCDRPNPNIDFAQTPFFVNTALRPWERPEGGVRRAGVSAFGFGGTNFHAVLEEHVPGAIHEDGGEKKKVSIILAGNGHGGGPSHVQASADHRTPLRGAMVLGGADWSQVVERLKAVQAAAAAGRAPALSPPGAADLAAPVRLAIDYGDAAELAAKAEKALRAFAGDHAGLWRALRAQGIFRGEGPASKVAFLYTGQGSQYLGMLAGLRETEPIVAATFAEADRVMTPILGRPLTDYIFPKTDDPEALAKADAELRQTAITQPAVLAVDIALTRLLAAYGVAPDMVMGHSLGEYGALVAAGCLSFAEALEAVAARGREMTKVSVADNGKMMAVMAPLEEIERVLASVDGYVVVANINSTAQAVIGGASEAVEKAAAVFREHGRDVRPLPVSHAFHTSIVEAASEPLRQMLRRLDLRPPQIPIISNATGGFHPMGPDAVPGMIDLLGRQIASPVQFVQGLKTLYEAGARVFAEVGPKRALQGFVEDVLGHEDHILALFTNHPKGGDAVTFNQALAGLYASGRGTAIEQEDQPVRVEPRPISETSVVVTGAAVGLPGDHPVFDDGNVRRILRGEQAIDAIPLRLRRAMVDKRITRLVKSEEGGGPRFETIASPAEVIKLAARAGRLDLQSDFGLPEDRLAAFDRATRLAIGAGLDALRDAGIPLVMRYKTTTTGTRLPDRWGLPDEMRDDTGVIFASAFPGYDSLVGQMEHYHRDKALRDRVAELESLRELTGDDGVRAEIDRRIAEIHSDLDRDPYTFDRRFLFQVLSMGHSQLAELIGARGPNTQINAACASTTQAFALAQDWITLGRCRRVVIVAADDITSDNLLGWFGSGFLASGAAATDELVEDAALPFDRRRHGLIIGMGAAAAVVETAEASRERGLRPICEVLGTVTANSAFHGSRLDVQHIAQVMETLVSEAETRWGIRREEIAPKTMFMSHETYTPARGGSAQAEVESLRQVFGAAAEKIVVANTKGFTGHPMAVGIEDVIAVKSLETGLVPPVANIKERDPEFGVLNLSRGGAYPVEYALRLGAGFGSQISMSLLRWTPSPDGKRRSPDELGYAYRIAEPAVWTAWLARVTGEAGPEVEVVCRTLRVVDRGMVKTAPLPSPHPLTPSPDPSLPPSPGEGEKIAVVVAPAEDEVQKKVLEIVARQTGYPLEMLALDLDMEADLGIDTVKQAETFAALRAEWNIPRDENLKLRDFPTLGHAIQFVYSKRPDLKAPAMAEPVAVAPTVETHNEVDEVKETVLNLIAEKTGYPRDMLDLDLDLEADLGVDTVKQAEMFAAIRQAYDIPRDENLKLRDFPTLAHTIQFVYMKRPDLKAQPAPAAPVVEAAPEAPVPASIEIPRRIPTPVLRPPLGLCKPTGVTLGEGSRVVVAFDQGGVGKALAGRLGKMGVEVLAIEGAPAAADLEALLRSWMAAGPVQGVYWLTAMDGEPEIETMDITAWKEANRVRVKLLYTTLRTLYDNLSFLISATRLGGRHGYDEAGAFAPLGGAVTGITKAFQREKPGALVKAVDFPAGCQTAALADALIEETLRDPGAVEIGREGERRWTVGLIEQPPGGGTGLSLTPETVFVVTGAAGSIVSAIVEDLTAAAKGGVFHLLDLAPEPDPADPDIARFVSDREGLKRDLFERIKNRGERATPSLVEKELARIERLQAALAAIEAIRANGGQAVYHRLDLRDADAVAQAMDRVRETAGRVDVLIHAGGLEISRLMPDKQPEEYDLVFDVKADGWFNLMKGLGAMPLGAAVVFSSIAGRFGNGGQTDYSAANDLLCKQISALRRTRPGTLGLAVDWTAWGGIGMATRGSIPKVMEAAGIDMLPPETGIPFVRQELTRGGAGEVVVAGRLGVMLQEFDETGGFDTAAGLVPTGVMTGKVASMGIYGGLTIETTLDPKEQPFLDDHRIDGTPVLPGVMGIEAFAEAATLLFPGLRVAAVEDVEFLAPFKFYRDEPRTLTVNVLFRREGDAIVADARLTGERRLPNQAEPQVTVHFKARVRLAQELPEMAAAFHVPAKADGVGAEDIYRVYFHGPAYRVMESAWRDGDGVAGRLTGELPPNHRPERMPTLMEPRLIELCFQTAGIEELGTRGRMALPLRVDSVTTVRHPSGESLYAVARPGGGEGDVDAYVVDDEGNLYLSLSGYHTVELPGGPPADRIAPLRAAMEVRS